MLQLTTDIAECNLNEENDITRAYDIFLAHIPKNTLLTIEETDGRMCARYLVRLTYTSGKTGRKITLLAKGNTLPTHDDRILHFYTSQIVLTPSEIGREFSRIYFRERVARQEMFLKGEYGNIRVSGKSIKDGWGDGAESEDKLNFEGYN